MTAQQQFDFWPPGESQRPKRTRPLTTAVRAAPSGWFHGADLRRWVMARIADGQQSLVLAFLQNEVAHRIGKYTADELTAVRQQLCAAAGGASAPTRSAAEDRRGSALGNPALSNPALNPDSFALELAAVQATEGRHA